MTAQDPSEVFAALGIALALGLLVGLQRERAASSIAGLRTFALITVLGTVSGFLARAFDGWILVGALLGVIAVAVLGNIQRLEEGHPDPGMTTEVAMLLMYGVGAWLATGAWSAAVAVGAGVAIILQFKPELHGLSARLDDRDVRAIMQFALISCIVLPVLPRRTFGPFDVLSPFEIWLMVVLIVGISLAGYIAYKFVGERVGILVGGLLGGAISSTATTVSFARRVASQPRAATVAAIVIGIASTVVYARILVEIGVAAPRLFPIALGPIAIVLVLVAAPSVLAWQRTNERQAALPPQDNPTELRAAVVFAGTYALVLLASAAAQQYLGGHGLYLVAALSGLTDVDAITLSTARMVGSGTVDPSQGWRVIVVGSLSNLIAKALIAGALGGRQLFQRLAMLWSLAIAASAALIALWPW